MARSHQDGPYYLSVNTLIQPMQERKTKVRKATCRSETNELPRFFIRFLTDPGDLVLDPFAGSNTTGAVDASEDLTPEACHSELVSESRTAINHRVHPDLWFHLRFVYLYRPDLVAQAGIYPATAGCLGTRHSTHIKSPFTVIGAPNLVAQCLSAGYTSATQAHSWASVSVTGASECLPFRNLSFDVVLDKSLDTTFSSPFDLGTVLAEKA
jgi:hypothetical protein